MMLGSIPRKWGKQNVLARRGSMRGLGALPTDNLEILKFTLWANSLEGQEDGCIKKANAIDPDFLTYYKSLESQLSNAVKDGTMSADDAISIIVAQCNDVLAEADKQTYKDARVDKAVSPEELDAFIKAKTTLEITKEILIAELLAFAFLASPDFKDAAKQDAMMTTLQPMQEYLKAVANNLALAILAKEITIETAKEEAKAQVLDILETDTTKQKYATQREDKALSDEEWNAIKATLAKKSKEESGVSEESTEKTSTTKIAVMAGVGVVALLGMAMIIKKS